MQNADLDAVIEALTNLKLLDTQIDRFASDFLLLVQPQLHHTSDKTFAEFESGPGVLKSRPGSDRKDASDALESVQTVIAFLESELPAEIAKSVFSKLGHSIVVRLTLGCLEPAMPMAVDHGIHDFDNLVSRVGQLADKIEALGWDGADKLRGWIKRVPMTWLARKRETSLAEVRIICARGIKKKRVAERVETEVLSKSDVMLAGPEQDTAAKTTATNEGDDDWDADWGDDDKAEEGSSTKQDPQPQEEDDDADAWGFGDDADEGEQQEEANGSTKDEGKKEDKAEEDDEDAWGWGDDENEKTASPVEKKAAPKSNGQEAKAEPAQQEITLRENYTVTSVPDDLLEIISLMIDDAEKLTDERYDFANLH
jgi:protein transport protein DSL1/ZW10